MQYTEDNGEMFKEHTPTDIPGDITPIQENNVAQCLPEPPKVINTSEKYLSTLKYLTERCTVSPIEGPYSIVFHVESEGWLTYYPKKDRLHRQKDNYWFDNGFHHIEQMYKNWQPATW